MKAWVLERPGPVTESGPLVLKEVDDPVADEGEIVIEVEACGICRTDLHIAQEEIPLPRLPIIPGHQAVGTVVTGSGDRFRKGERVGVAWLHETCGACADCFRGDENLCRHGRYTGFHANGGFAEYLRIPEAFAYALPADIPSTEAAPLLCAGIIGYRALRQADVQEGESVGLYGFGSSAHIALQVARSMGCRVYVLTRSKAHQALAREMGAEWVGDSDGRPPEILDRAVIFAPAGELVPRALEAVRWGGTVASAAIHMSPIPQIDYDGQLLGEKTLRSTTASTRQDGEELLELASEGLIRTRVQVFPFQELGRGLRALQAGRIQGSAVLRVR